VPVQSLQRPPPDPLPIQPSVHDHRFSDSPRGKQHPAYDNEPGQAWILSLHDSSDLQRPSRMLRHWTRRAHDWGHKWKQRRRGQSA